MTKERNDFSGPIGNRVPWEEFSTEFLSKIATLWQKQWEAFTNGMVRVGSRWKVLASRTPRSCWPRSGRK